MEALWATILFSGFALEVIIRLQKILSRSTKASTMMHDLVPEDFLNETFLVPSIDEQKAVGKFLHQIDNLLTLHQRKLEMLKNVKQAFLEKMFV